MIDDVVTYEEKAAQLRPEIRDAIETALGWSSHGTLFGYYRHRSRHTVPCEPCREAAKSLPSSVRGSIARRDSEQWGEDNSWQLTRHVRAQWAADSVEQWGVDHPVRYL